VRLWITCHLRQLRGLLGVVWLLLPVKLDGGGDAVVLAGEDVVLAEGMADPVFGAEDAAEVGVVVEDDAEQVEGFAFVPIGGVPEVGDGGDVGIGAGAEGLDGEGVAEFEAVEVVDNGHFVIGDVIDATEVGQPVELEGGVVSENLSDGSPVGSVEVDAGMLTLGMCLNDLRGEPGL